MYHTYCLVAGAPVEVPAPLACPRVNSRLPSPQQFLDFCSTIFLLVSHSQRLCGLHRKIHALQ